SEYDLIQIPSFAGRSFLLDSAFLPIEKNKLSRWNDISVDFRSLDYDPNDHYLLPLTWGLNGFVVDARDSESVAESLDEILSVSGDKKHKISVLPEPSEIFALMVKLRPVVRTFVETGNESELKKEIREIKPLLRDFDNDPRKLLESGDFRAAQAPNGLVAGWLNENTGFRYVLPKEKASLWVRSIGIATGARDVALSRRILNHLLDPVVAEELVRTNEQATTLTTVDEKKLPPLQRAQFIRMVPLSRVELLMSSDALEPL